MLLSLHSFSFLLEKKSSLIKQIFNFLYLEAKIKRKHFQICWVLKKQVIIVWPILCLCPLRTSAWGLICLLLYYETSLQFESMNLVRMDGWMDGAENNWKMIGNCLDYVDQMVQIIISHANAKMLTAFKSVMTSCVNDESPEMRIWICCNLITLTKIDLKKNIQSQWTMWEKKRHFVALLEKH